MSKRRLLLVSTPFEDDYSYQQQLSAFSGQECPMGQWMVTGSHLLCHLMLYSFPVVS